MPRSTKSIRGKYLLVLLVAITACVSMGLVLSAPRVALATGAGGGKLEQLRQAYEDAQAAYEIAEENVAAAHAFLEAKNNDLSEERAQAEALQAQADIINQVSAKKNDLDAAQAAVLEAEEAEAAAGRAIIKADEDVSGLETQLQSSEEILDEAKRALDLKRQELANALAINVDEVTDEMLQQRYPQDVANVAKAEKIISELKQQLREAQGKAFEARNALGNAQAKVDAAYDALDVAQQAYDDALEAADQARAALARILKVDVSQVTDDLVASNVAEAWLEVDGAQAAYNQAKAEYEAAEKALEDARAARDAALYALENYDPADEYGLPPTGDGATLVPIALLDFASLAVLAAARRRQES